MPSTSVTGSTNALSLGAVTDPAQGGRMAAGRTGADQSAGRGAGYGALMQKAQDAALREDTPQKTAARGAADASAKTHAATSQHRIDAGDQLALRGHPAGDTATTGERGKADGAAKTARGTRHGAPDASPLAENRAESDVMIERDETADAATPLAGILSQDASVDQNGASGRPDADPGDGPRGPTANDGPMPGAAAEAPRHSAGEPDSEGAAIALDDRARTSGEMRDLPSVQAHGADGVERNGDVAAAGQIATIGATAGSAQAATPSGAATPLPVTVAHPDWPDDMVAGISRAAMDGAEALTLTLTPERLGSVQIRLSMEDGALQVQIVTETAEAARVFAEAQHRLVDAMARAGLELAPQSAGTPLNGTQGPGAQGAGQQQQGDPGQAAPDQGAADHGGADHGDKGRTPQAETDAAQVQSGRMSGDGAHDTGPDASSLSVGWWRPAQPGAAPLGRHTAPVDLLA